jgi:phosphoglycolate phosphatase-like HAD superfamily hydrolase
MNDMQRLSIFIDTFKDYFKLSDFTVVTAADTVKPKPDPEGLLLALHRLGSSPDEALVIGDHTIDIESAKNASVVVSIGVTHGFDDRERLLSSNPTKIIDSLKELIEYIV